MKYDTYLVILMYNSTPRKLAIENCMGLVAHCTEIVLEKRTSMAGVKQKCACVQ